MRTTRNRLLVTSGLLVGGFFGVLAFERLVGFLSHAAATLPSQNGQSRVNAHGEAVYAAVNGPSVTVQPGDVTRVGLSDDHKIDAIDPYTQLIRLAGTHVWMVAAVLVGLIVLATVVLNVVPVLRARRPRWLYPLSAVVASGAGGFLLLAYVTQGARRNWDEVFVFASQARNFARTGVAGVPVTGPRGVAESSADVGATVVAGVFMKLFPAIHGETALAFAIVTMLILFALATIYALRVWFGVGRVMSILVGLGATVLLPQTMLATASAVPSGVATGALALFAVTMLHSLRTRRTASFAVVAVVVAFVRWEYGLIAILAACVLLAVQLLRVRRGTAERWGVRPYIGLAIPFIVFLVETVYRILVFGALAPSGVVGKSVGFDGAYISSGLNYLATTSGLSLWPMIVIVLIAAVLIARRSTRATDYLLVTAVVLVPLINSVLAGADIFNVEWERYVTPSVASVLVITAASFGGGIVREHRLRFITVPIAIVFLFSQLSISSYVASDLYQPELAARTSCLARAGETISRIVPVEQGVGSAEVNTVAYFAGAPVTDLYGIIDPRTASVPPSPHNAGADMFERRSNSAIIYSDKPAAIYLYEGANCSVNAGVDVTEPRPNRTDDATAWSTLLNSGTTKFRAGDLSTLLASYGPVTVVVRGEMVLHVLVRRDLLPEVASR